jgi:putative inorganic carbon (hco3(-)) transporter
MQPQARRGVSQPYPERPLRQAVKAAAPGPAAPYRWTPIALAATCALTPAYVIRPHFGPLPTTVLELALLATLIIFGIERWMLRLPVEWPSRFAAPLLLFLAAGAVGVAVSGDHRAALGLYKAYMVEPALVFVVMVDAIRSRRDALVVLGGLGVAGAVAGGLNAVVVLHAAMTHHLDLSVAAPVAIYNNANSVALFLVPLIAIAGSLALRLDGAVRWLAVAFLVVALSGVLLSFSRGGYVALAAVLLVLAAADYRRRILVPAVVLAGVVFSLLPPIAHRLAHEFSATDPNNTLHARVVIWQATLRMLRDHPIFGAGLSGFKLAIGPYRAGSFKEDLVYPHNILLNFWSEVGIVGAIAFAWILVLGLVLAFRAWRRLGEPWSAISLGVFAALVAVVVHGLVDVPYWKNDLSVEFWALLALPVAALTWTRLVPIRR